MFLTRIPVPAWVGYSDAQLSQSVRYFPLVGLLVGALAALVYLLAAIVFPHPVAIFLGVIVTVIVTGALHEDGLADACDGFGGGRSRDDVLRIMKDSHIGAYGAIGLMLIVGIKIVTLCSLAPNLVPCVLIIGHAVSRLAAVVVMFATPYARGADGKANALAAGFSSSTLLISAALGLMPVLFMEHILFPASILALLVAVVLRKYFLHRIGGYTGDCLGATQQITEVALYLSFLAIAR